MKTLVTYVGILSVFAATATTVSAEIFEFSCGNVEFNLDMTNGTLSDRFNPERPVEWRYADDVVQWRERSTDTWSGVNIKTGGLVLGAQEDPNWGCIVPDDAYQNLMAHLSSGATKSVSKSDEVRILYEALSESERIKVQGIMSNQGYYKGVMDGQFGPMTSAAIESMTDAMIEVGLVSGADRKAQVESLFFEMLQTDIFFPEG